METVPVLVYIIMFLFGITVGSFLNVCIYRLPKGESVVTAPSHCMSCGKRLRPIELIPVFSFIFLRGRCSACKSRISAQYPLIEAANGVLWVLVLWRLGLTAGAALGSLMASCLLVISLIDARTREIPAGLNLFLLILGAINLVLHLQDWPLYVIGFFAVSLPLYIILIATGGRGIGGGDIKLMAAAGFLLGWKLIILSLFIGCVLGSVIHLSLMALKKAGRQLAFGPYLAAGILTAYLYGEVVLNWYFSMF